MVLALGIRYLTGYAVATDPASRQRPEWPPHPARVFMAMAAAYFETGQDPTEAEALQWLETLDEPLIHAAEADERTVVITYVPVNDKPTGNGMLQSVTGLTRNKQPRGFPCVRPHDETVYLVWPNVEANGHRAALERVCSKVTRIGHPASLVQMWVTDRIPEDSLHKRWEPDDKEGEIRLRVFGAGSLRNLEQTYQAWHQRGARAPAPLLNGLQKGYWRPRIDKESIAGTVWDPYLIVRRLEPMESRHWRLDLVSTLQVTAAMHKAAIEKVRDLVPEFISGHRPDGSPTDQPHLAYLPLAFVGPEHATGHLMGLAFAVPIGLKRDERQQALAAVGQVDELMIGPLGRWRLRPDDQGKANLRPEVWTGGDGGATQWATVTPIAFDKHAKAKDRAEREKELADMIKTGCQRIGLPEPVQVIVTAVSTHLGTPAAHEFPRLLRKDGSERRHAHVILIFDSPVRGPIVVGAGRYRGYGFFRPLRGLEAV
jgi:CRISPR-associated protein Csb2